MNPPDKSVPQFDSVQIVARLLKEMYPQNPDIVLSIEARRICERLAKAGLLTVRDED